MVLNLQEKISEKRMHEIPFNFHSRWYWRARLRWSFYKVNGNIPWFVLLKTYCKKFVADLYPLQTDTHLRKFHELWLLNSEIKVTKKVWSAGILKFLLSINNTFELHFQLSPKYQWVSRELRATKQMLFYTDWELSIATTATSYNCKLTTAKVSPRVVYKSRGAK